MNMPSFNADSQPRHPTKANFAMNLGANVFAVQSQYRPMPATVPLAAAVTPHAAQSGLALLARLIGQRPVRAESAAGVIAPNANALTAVAVLRRLMGEPAAFDRAIEAIVQAGWLEDVLEAAAGCYSTTSSSTREPAAAVRVAYFSASLDALIAHVSKHGSVTTQTHFASALETVHERFDRAHAPGGSRLGTAPERRSSNEQQPAEAEAAA